MALTGLWAQTVYTFSDGGRKTTHQLSQDEVFSARGNFAGRSTAGSSKEWAGGMLVHLQKGPDVT